MTYEAGKPIKPEDLGSATAELFPPAVFDVFNEQIAARWSGGSAIVYQDDVVAALTSRLGVDRHQIFDKGWLNIEPAYRAQGWRVEYDKPAYNESYRANFTFSKK